MNQEQAKAWLPLIQAVAEGKTIQLNDFDWIEGQIGHKWSDVGAIDFTKSVIRYRIKPEPRKAWYRVVLFRNGTTTAETEYEEKRWSENNPNFVRWLTDRIEYELPEGEA